MTDAQRLWERSRRAGYAEITAIAMRLFLDQGFERTTIDQISEEAGISRRSFFRYFGTKEDIVLGDLARQGGLARDALEAVPVGVGPWEALRAALVAVEALEVDPDTTLRISRMLYGTPSLRARRLEKHAQWQALLVPNIRVRLGVPADDEDDPGADAIVASAIACLDVAGEVWTTGGGAQDLADLYDRAVAAVRGTAAR